MTDFELNLFAFLWAAIPYYPMGREPPTGVSKYIDWVYSHPPDMWVRLTGAMRS